MNDSRERLSYLNNLLSEGEEICGSEGVLCDFPTILKKPFEVKGVGVVICRKGSFRFVLNNKPYSAKERETLFLAEKSVFQVLEVSPDLRVSILFYQVEPIRDIIGNDAASMHLYSLLGVEPCCVWETGEEEELEKYMSLLNNGFKATANPFSHNERNLLLLALTNRLCSIHNRKLKINRDTVGGKYDTFIRLIRLIEQHYIKQRRVEFYADKLCLSPKYLSSLSKSISGYTVQELVFKFVIRKSVALLKNTSKSVQEISDYLNFSNASQFGTFFKKQVGVSPMRYRLGENE